MKRLLIAFALAAPLFAAEQSLRLTPDNTKIEWTLTDPLHTVHGTFQLKRGAVTFDTDSGKASGEVLVDVKSGQSGSGARDSRMHANVLESAKYPDAVFTPDHIEGKIAATGVSTVKLHGSLQIHGATHEITATGEVKASGGQMETTLTFDIPYVAWGMKDPSNFLLKVSKSVRMAIHTTAIYTTAIPQP
jgi:polyisoprenoid-binding protein YceI